MNNRRIFVEYFRIEKGIERKTGFELWMESMENELRSHYDGDDDGFLKYATRQFRQLTADDKKVCTYLSQFYSFIIYMKCCKI